MTQDPMIRRRELADSMNEKAARLLELSRENDRNGGISPSGLVARAMREPDVAPAEAQQQGHGASDAGFGRGVPAQTGYRAQVRAAEEAGNVAESIRLKHLRLDPAFDEMRFDRWQS